MSEQHAGGRAMSIPSQTYGAPETKMSDFLSKNNISLDPSETSSSIKVARQQRRETKEAIKVCVRVRPMLQHERSNDEVIYYPDRK
jgi:hypothetical protein